MLKNRYLAKKVLSRSGSTEAFLVEDTQDRNEYKYMKILEPAIKHSSRNNQLNQVIRQKFQNEAEKLKKLGNKCNQIPKTYEYFEESGRFFVIQELIKGKTLSEIFHSRRSSEKEVREILDSLLLTLDYCHLNRILHRDIKPDNIIVRQSDNKPVFVDFGTIKSAINTVERSSGDFESVEIGSPSYMPRELIAGRAVESSDLYSLGVTAISLLTCQSPMRLYKASSDKFQWRNYASEVSSALATILDKATQGLARERFWTAREMLNALHSPLSEEAVPLSPIEVATANHISSLEKMVISVLQRPSIYAEHYQHEGDFMSDNHGINVTAGENVGMVGGRDVTNEGLLNLGIVSGNVTNVINKLPDLPETNKSSIKNLLTQLQSAIEAEPQLSSEDKIEALEQVETLAKAGQKPEDSNLHKAAKTAMKILKGTVSGLSETNKLVQEFAKLLPAIAALLTLV